MAGNDRHDRPHRIPVAPPETTHVLLYVNPDRLVAESTRSDNAAVPVGSVLPNFTIKPPSRLSNGGIAYGYAVGGLAVVTTKYVTADLFYADDANRPVGPVLASRTLELAAGTDKTLTVEPANGALPAPPAGATRIVARIDGGGAGPETNDTDNLTWVSLAVILPNYRPGTRTRQPDGGLTVRVEADAAAKPSGLIPRVGFFWATGPNPADIIG